MLDDVYSSPRALSRLRECLLAEHLDARADHLAARGHAARTVRSYLAAALHLSHWMESERVRVAELSNGVLLCFLQNHLPSCRCSVPTGGALYMVRAAMRHVMDVLVARGAVQKAEFVVSDPIEQVLQEFMTHLRDTCGLAESTISGRTRYARAFLATRSGRDFSDLKTTQLIEFLNSCALCRRAPRNVVFWTLCRQAIRPCRRARCRPVWIPGSPATRFPTPSTGRRRSLDPRRQLGSGCSWRPIRGVGCGGEPSGFCPTVARSK